MKYIQIALVLLACQWHVSVAAVQNLCGDARDAGFLFATDPASCNRYLYCTFNADNSVNTTFQYSCDDPDFPEFSRDFCWPLGATDCEKCPDLNEGILYGTDTDTTCQNFEACVLPGGIAAGTCGDGLNFDRSSGTCVEEQWAPCYAGPGGDGTANVDCNGQTDGTRLPVPDSCTLHVLCIGNVVFGTFECRPGTHFDPTAQVCVAEEDFPCPPERRQVVIAPNRSLPDTLRAKRKRFPNDRPF